MNVKSTAIGVGVVLGGILAIVGIGGGLLYLSFEVAMFVVGLQFGGMLLNYTLGVIAFVITLKSLVIALGYAITITGVISMGSGGLLVILYDIIKKLFN